MIVAKHRVANAINDVADLNGQWHIGRGWPGMFPHIEAACPCPKAPCGLVIPSLNAYCSQHYGMETIRQAHRASECKPMRTRKGNRR